MKRLGVLSLLLAHAIAGEAAVAPHATAPSQREQFPQPTPADDPELPPIASPDILAPDDGQGEQPSPFSQPED